jgi:hypothetical protein
MLPLSINFATGVSQIQAAFNLRNASTGSIVEEIESR